MYTVGVVDECRLDIQRQKIDSITDEYEGFVYLITNTTNGMKYIGKKLARNQIESNPSLKGRKTKDVDTKKVTGVHIGAVVTHLNNDVAELGEDKFTREILEFCTTRGVMSYIEAELAIPNTKYY